MNEEIRVPGEEKIYIDLLEQLQSIDLPKVAASKKLPLQSGGTVLIESFARSYFVSQEGVTATDGRPITTKQKLAVVSYLLSESTGAPAFEFIPFGHLGGFNIGREQHAGKSIKQPLLLKFGDDYSLFAWAALKIGGVEQEASTADKHVWLFHAFPNLLIQVIFYEQDEEFPADVQVMFDSKALDYFGTKCLGFLPGYFTTALMEGAADI